MKIIKIVMLILIKAFFITQLSSPAFALSTDRDQPADIEADDIEFNFKKGTRTYIGNVLAVQGTLKIKADRLIANYDDGELRDAKAWGSLARFRQRPDGKQHDVEGSAQTITVDQKNNTLTLKGKASLKQGSDTARGEIITYNMATDTLRVKGGAKVAAKKKPDESKTSVTPTTSAASNQGAKKLEDPFKDSELESKEQEQIKPAASGRSRLIIQPK